jgi:hypothetical protein
MSVDAEQHFQKLAKRSGIASGGQTLQQRSASNMSSAGARPKLGGTGSPQEMDEENNGEEEFEDAPEGDDESFGSSSMGSTNVTPRGGGAGTGSSTEQGPPPDMPEQSTN